ncbi:MAG: hypothetical protein AAF267_10565 [Deinococcota bacterium]
MAGMLVSHAQVNLTDGTEIIVTDENSEVILGHGTVMSGQFDLTLNMDGDNLDDNMVVLFISPDGTFVTLRGYIGADNNFWLTDEDNSQLTNLASLSRDANLNLAISGTAATAFATSNASDDNLLRDPNQVTQPALGATPATQPRQSRFAFGESDSDDRDRRVTNTAVDITDGEDAVVSPPPSSEPDPPTSPDLPRDDPSDNFGEPNDGSDGNDGGSGDSPDVVGGGDDGDEPDSPEVSKPEPDNSDGDDSDGDSGDGDDSGDDDNAGTEDNGSDDNDDTNSDDDDGDDTSSDEDGESTPDDADEPEDGASQ